MKDAQFEPGIGGYNYTFVITSLYGHGFKALYPTKGKNTDDAFWAIQHFVGTDYVQRLYSNDAKEIRKACRQLGIPWEAPGMS